MRICMVLSTPFPPEEGIGNYVYNLSKKLIERKHRVTVITRGSFKNDVSFTNDIRLIKVFFIPFYPFHVNIHGFFVDRVFKSWKGRFDIVHIHTPLTPVIKTSLPIVSTIHTSMIEDARHIEVVDLKSAGTKVLTKLVSYPLVSKLIENSKVVTTVSNSVAYELKKYYGLDNAVVVGNGVDEKSFTPAKEKSEENYILYVGRLSYRKGLFDLVESAKQICRRYNILYTLVGKGELEGKLKKKIRDEKLQDKVILLGHVDRTKLIHLYRNALIFVLPSHYEGLPTVLLEAMACGLPVVATAVSGNLEVISHNENGILIPPKKPKAMANAISGLLDDAEKRRKISESARRTIEERYTWDIIANKMLECYESLLERY